MVAAIVAAIFVVGLLPFALVWAANVILGMQAAYTLKTWCAAVVIILITRLKVVYGG